MKKTLVLLVLCSASASAVDDENVASCELMGEWAAKIMEARQNNIPMSKLMEIVGSDKASRQIVIGAYETPAFSGEKLKKETIAQFRNAMELACYKQRG